MLQSQEHSPSSPTCSPTHNLNKDKMKILQKSHGRFCEIWFATESSRHHPHFSLLAFKWAAQKHKMLWETSFFFQNRSRFTSILLSTLQFQVCTWQLSIPIQWLWNTTSRDSKANNTHATGHRILKLSLRVMFKGFIFSFPHASGLCCSLVLLSSYLSEWQPQIPEMLFIQELHRKIFLKHSGSETGCKNILCTQMYCCSSKEDDCQIGISKTPEVYAIINFQNQKILQNQGIWDFKSNFTIIGKAFKKPLALIFHQERHSI